MNQWKSSLFWILGGILAVLIGVFQRMTGPTYPIRGEEVFGDTEVQYHLARSHTEYEDLEVSITTLARDIDVTLSYRRYPTDDPWSDVMMERSGDTWTAAIPGQPSAGKVEYTVRIDTGGESYLINGGESVVARFKGKVPAPFLIAHVVLMFLGIVFGLRTGMEALRREGRYGWLVTVTLALVFVGGLILGPIVQKYAFGEIWTGFPFGFDLTDNKTLLIFIVWLLAFFLKKKSRWWVVAATLMMLVVYLIPHSVLGSELDYSTGELKNVYSSLTPG